MPVTEASPFFKGFLALLLSGFVPVTTFAFLYVRRSKKAVEFARVVNLLGIAADVADFARSRVAEHFAAGDYRLPTLFAWLMSVFGFVSLLFGGDLVAEHQGKVNMLLTATATGTSEELQALRVQSMVVLGLAFLGAFIWSAQAILYRLNAGDLSPSVYFNAGIRMILAPVLSLMISHLIYGFEPLQGLRGGLPAIAFLVGWFPDRALIFLKEQFPAIFRDRRRAHDLPLNMIEGVHTYDRARLYELGIADAQNLASANLVELIVRTAFNPSQVIDWIGQARLYTAFKDQVTALRERQIRSVFDLLPICGEHETIAKLAQASGIDALGMQLFCNRLMDEPGVQQLLELRRRLCRAGEPDDGTPDRVAVPARGAKAGG